MNVKDIYGFSGTVEQAIKHEIDESPGYYGGEIESLRAKVDAIKGMVARFMASQISNAKELNSVVGFDRYLDDK